MPTPSTTILLFNQPSRSTQPGHPSVGRWVVIRHAVYIINVVVRAIETEISAALWAHVAREGLIYIILHMEHQNCY